MKISLTTTQKKIITACTILGALIGTILLISGYITPVYTINDDMTIRSILKGDYTGTPDGHVIYLQYPLSGLLSLLYSVADLPWLEVLMFAAIVGSLFVIIYDSPNRLISFLLCVIIGYPLYFQMHYTTTAALLAAAAVITIYRDQRNFPVPILWLLSYMIRKDVGILCLPFLALGLLFRIMNLPKADCRKNIVRFVRLIAVLLLGWILCLGINGFCYGSDEWKEFQIFQQYRTSLYDYTDFIPSEYYKTHYEEFGMTADQYHIWSTYNILLDESLNTGKITQLSQDVMAHMIRNRDAKKWLITTVKTYLYQICYEHSPYSALCVIGYLLAIILMIRKKRWKQLIPITCLFVGKNLIALFFLWQGRFPERVAISLYLMEFMSILGMAESVVDQKPLRLQKPLLKFAALCAAVILSVTGYSVLKDTWIRNQTILGYQSSWERIKEYCREHPDQIYWGYTFSLQSYAGVPYEETVSNLYMLGCWTANSPLLTSVYDKLGVTDAAQSLVYNENTHLFIEENRDIEALQNYFNHRFGTVIFEPVDQIDLGNGTLLVDYQLKQIDIEP